MKVIFMDRDGVINKDPEGWTAHSYVTRADDFRFLPGALEALRILKKNGVKVIVISNQAGVSKGYFSEEELDAVNKRMLATVERNGGSIDKVYYCVHKEADGCDCRKPKTGLFEKAAMEYTIEVKGAYFIGDSEVDAIAGKKMGLKTIFVLSGKTSREEMEGWDQRPDYAFDNLLEAVKWLIDKEAK